MEKIPVIANQPYFRKGYFLEDIGNNKFPIFLDPGNPVGYPQNQPPRFITDSDKNSPTLENLLNKNSSEDVANWLEERNFQLGFFTSGSTGEKKIFPKTEKEIFSEINMLKSLLSSLQMVEKSDGDSSLPPFLVSIPLCHIYGFLWGYMLPVVTGCPVVDSFNISETIRELKNNTYSFWIAVPSQIQAVFDLWTPASKNSLEKTTVISSGSALPENLAYSFVEKFGSIIWEIYGSTETGGMGYKIHISSNENNTASGYKLFPGVNIQIQESRISVASPHIHSDLPDASGYFKTGDSGYIEDDRIIYTGRLDRIVKRNGKRIHLDDLEREIESSRTSWQAIAIEWEKERIGLVLETSEKMDKSEVQNLIYNLLPKHLLPNDIRLVESIPRTSNGKKDYKNAKEEFLKEKN